MVGESFPDSNKIKHRCGVSFINTHLENLHGEYNLSGEWDLRKA